ncbi:MAG: hypothetical protein HS104_19680 [Polyangiaceae bacterium]|nr:hypothetical protein [Polyangiaceae bacterium]MCE7889082.1 hypothetical protein [Sorangiineae bacterium PRO1]MCL4755583.1 hypothetical protein [Myxococcales bacterium]
MSCVRLSIEPDLCGPVSVGTVKVIRVVERTLELSLGEALRYVNRSVFDGETVCIPAPSPAAAAACVAELDALRTGASVRAHAEAD